MTAAGPIRPESGSLFGVGFLAKFRGVTILVALALLILAMSLIEPNFLTTGNVTAVLLSAAIVAILAAGQSVVIISGNIDLSVGSIVGLGAFVAGLLLEHGWGLAETIIVIPIMGAVLGLGNGVLVGIGGAPAIVITLGTLNIYRGILLAAARGQAINAYNLPRSYLDIASSSIFGLPIMVLLAVVVVAVLAVFMRWTVAGRRVYAMGGNRDGARVLGIRTTSLTIWVFVLSGLVAGAAGVLWGSTYATVDSGAATGLELTVITAVVVGGVNIFGGSGNVVGAAAGALLLATLANALTLLAVSPFWLGAIQGMLILAAITTDASVGRYLRRLHLPMRRMQ